MLSAFTVEGKIEHGVKKKELESVDLMTEDLQQMWVKQKRGKRWKMREFAMRFVRKFGQGKRRFGLNPCDGKTW
jgi:hypothetical protein